MSVLLGNDDGTFGSFTTFPGAGTSDEQRMVIGTSLVARDLRLMSGNTTCAGGGLR